MGDISPAPPHRFSRPCGPISVEEAPLGLFTCSFLHQWMVNDFWERIYEGIRIQIDDRPSGEMGVQSEKLIGRAVESICQTAN